MKTPIDNGTPGATLALLNSGGPFVMADASGPSTLNGGAVIRWHEAPASRDRCTFNGQTYVKGPGIDRAARSRPSSVSRWRPSTSPSPPAQRTWINGA